MKRQLFPLALVAVLFLSGCDYIQQFMGSTPVEEDPPASSELSMQEKEVIEKYGEDRPYREYQQGDIGNGQGALLYFTAAWCAECRKYDKSLMDWYEANYMPTPTYRVDYDSETDLRSRYNVEKPGTFVRVNGTGQMTGSAHLPTEIEVLEFLRP